MNVFVEKYILISGFLAFLEVKVLGKVLIWMSAWSVQIISGLGSQSKFQMFTLFYGRHVGVLGEHQRGGPILGQIFVQNIFTNIWRSGKRTNLKFGGVFQLFVSSNLIISCVYEMNGFRIIFWLRDGATQELDWN